VREFFRDTQTYNRSLYTGPPKRYGFFSFLFDCFMVFITSGFWLIWIFIREMRGNRR
jgi:hypothetical protein